MRLREAMANGNHEGLGGLFRDDALVSIAGRGSISGEHHGPAAIASDLARMRDLTGGSFRAFAPDVYDVLVSDRHTVLVDRYVAERGGRRLDSHEVWLVSIDGGRIRDCIQYLHDQPAFDEFWS